MHKSQIQKIVDTQNISLQEVSEKSGLSVGSIQTLELRIIEDLANLQKVAKALNIPISKLLEAIGSKTENKTPDRNPAEWFCELFPQAPGCTKQ
ncbi:MULTISPECIES: helix-turn-helix domain-containing protein [unclassified Leptolyngbya]|uniref:helix-turn-helix domain-containing protein n=1 Tax=unclassified Leptolyngbya TaxID=2650499 RepID=UPI001AC54D00|nr:MULTISPECIES: helix-turn-helix transcriptional regulator [unclassified Leptolyngbya]MBN8563754.1 helix-turn-helix transcriptional regulator [Leptolyngbya sp. UWPOB_LEPTO1]MCY6494078.1 helix-turn-helix transcriptional regulator [Leptolyngbya sp. GGD]